MTPEEITTARHLIITEELASAGLTSVAIDGMSVSLDRDAAKRRLELLDSLAVRNSAHPLFGLRLVRLKPPGGGG